MPLPTPKNNESEDEFISRCMSDDQAEKDFPDQDQRLAVCFSQFEEKKESTLKSFGEFIKEAKKPFPKNTNNKIEKIWEKILNDFGVKRSRDSISLESFGTEKDSLDDEFVIDIVLKNVEGKIDKDKIDKFQKEIEKSFKVKLVKDESGPFNNKYQLRFK